MHGLALFDENGEEVFSSEYKYLKVLKMGEVTINNLNEIKTISLPPQKVKPKLTASGNYYYREEVKDYMSSYIVKPMIGDLSKDSNGNYVSFKIGMETSQSFVYNQTSAPFQPIIDVPWVIPYVVFI